MGGDLSWSATARLVRRAGFGAPGREVDAAHALGRTRWLATALRADPAVDAGSASTPPPVLGPVPDLPASPARSERRARNALLHAQRDALATWWVRRMVVTGTPVVERVTLGWHQLFATDLRVVHDARMMLAQNETQRRTGRSTHADVLRAMLTDAALLSYLDGSATSPGTRNENLARELFEVFTLGRTAGWSERDVREAARALTGWTVGPGGPARLVPEWHDAGAKTVLGRTGIDGVDDLVMAILAQPTAATHLVNRWCAVLLSSSPASVPGEVTRRGVAAYGRGGDLGAVLQTVLTDAASEAMPASLVRTPLEWVVGSARSLSLALDDEQAGRAVAALRALGQEPFCPPNVGGWPSGRAWLSTGAAETRYATAAWLAGLADLTLVEGVAPAGRVDATAHLLGLPPFSDRTVVGLRTLVRDPRALVAAALVSPESLVV